MISADSVLIELEMLTYKEVVSFKDEKTALSCSTALVNCLYLNFKNRLMYIPSNKNKHVNETYEAIYKEFSGHNQQELAIKYNRSTQNIYSIIKRETEKQVKKYQIDLFPGDIQQQDNRSITILVLEDYLPTEFIYCGLEDQQAKQLSSKISNHICSTFPGVSIYISEAIRNKRNNKTQTSIF